MISKEYLDNFIEGFEQRKNRDFEWNAKLFEKSDHDSWSQILIDRSKDLRECFEINELAITELQKSLDHALSEEECLYLYDAAMRLYTDGYDDVRVFSILLEPAIDHFSSTGDLDHLLPLLHAYAFEFEQADLEGVAKPKHSYEEVLSYKDRYEEMDSRYARLCLFKSYSNVISRLLNSEEKGSFAKMHELYLEALSVWESEAFQKKDGEDEEFAYFINRMLQTITLYENIDELTPEELLIFEDLLKKGLKEAEEDNSEDSEEESEEEGYLAMVRVADLMLRNLKKEISNEKTLESLLSYFDASYAKLDLNEDPNEQEDYIDDCYNLIATLCFFLSGPKQVKGKEKDIIERMNQMRFFLKSLPYSFYNGEMNRYAYLLFQRIRPFMSKQEKKEFLLEVVMFRQPITFIHSKMVERLSFALAEFLLDLNPSFFLGVKDTKTAEEVIARKEEILSFISECALYHDVGKVTLVDIINTQNRRLTEMEFAKIKTHPENGLSTLEKDPDFAPYYDVMLGHHKWYDGSNGYPSSFDSVNSRLRFVIDIVTIADCSDSATDILGRNYAKGKAFRTVLGEFIAGAGTRYNPDIVAAIANNEAMIKKLEKLTGEGRFEVYKEVYSRYIHG